MSEPAHSALLLDKDGDVWAWRQGAWMQLPVLSDDYDTPYQWPQLVDMYGPVEVFSRVEIKESL